MSLGKEDRRIPLVVAQSGHRHLNEAESEAVRESVRGFLREFAAQYPDSPHVFLTCLAEGADQLCAEEALKEGYALAAVLPMAYEEYEKDFQGEALEKLRVLTAEAATVLVAPDAEKRNEAGDDAAADRRYHYRQANIYLVQHSHVLMAVWDGKAGRPGGCGTSDTVEMKLWNAYRDVNGSLLHPEDGAVAQIRASRSGAGPLPPEEAGKVIWLGDRNAFRVLCERTEEYNRDALQSGNGGYDLAGTRVHGQNERTAERISGIYKAADSMSVQNQAQNRKVLAFMSVAATVVTVAFLLYDEAEMYWMILVCGLMILALFAVNRIEGRLQCHRKYPEYRVLAEAMRVQFYMWWAGCPFEVSEQLPWTLQIHLPWVRKAAAAVMIGNSVPEAKSVMDDWILDQKTYHRNALEKTLQAHETNERIERIALIAAIISYIAALIFEIVMAGLLGAVPRMSPERIELFRTVLKIVLGGLSAGTLFAGNYYGKLSLTQNAEDHKKMAALFEEAECSIGYEGETREILERLAQEALGENSAWYVFQSMNEPDISL